MQNSNNVLSRWIFRGGKKGMVSRNPGRKVFIWLLLFLSIAIVHNGSAVVADDKTPGVTKDMVWSATDGLRQEIFFSSWKNNAWSTPVQVTNNNADNLAPCIDTAGDGKKYLVWLSVEGQSQEIQYAVFDGTQWSEAKTLPSLPAHPGAPFVAVDDKGVVWVVFAGNENDDDDIYSTRFINGKWSASQRVNVENESPDIDPFIEITRDKRVAVTWSGFRENTYVTLQSVWDGKKWQAETVVAEDKKSVETDDQESQMPLPDFVTDKKQVFTRSYDK